MRVTYRVVFKSEVQQLSNRLCPELWDLRVPWQQLRNEARPQEAGMHTWEQNAPVMLLLHAPWESLQRRGRI